MNMRHCSTLINNGSQCQSKGAPPDPANRPDSLQSFAAKQAAGWRFFTLTMYSVAS
jgi:hypothetical protein